MSKHHLIGAIHQCVGGRWAVEAEGAATIPCVTFGSHVESCDGEECRGCQPRLVEGGGWLCETCHRYLAEWLADGATHSLLWVHRWLTFRLQPSLTVVADDMRRPGVTLDLPSAMSETIYDARQLIEDRVFIADERARQVFEEPLADLPPFDFAESVAWLRNRLFRIERHRDLTAMIYARFQDAVGQAHRVAPWRATATKVGGREGMIPCPHCQRKTLMQFGGNSYVSCLTCHATISDDRFGIWTRMIEEGA